mgnify:CR=1 FL=1
MYNKISSIILNSGKASGFSDVFIAQPDSLKEGLAGKVFIVAEIGAKKNEAKKIFDFLIDSLEVNYYDDEKIMLREKIEGLKVENIFEAAVSKTNKGLADFLTVSKIKINSAMTNITLGVVFENKLYFTSYGRNRAFLVYLVKDRYEIINVEANAADEERAASARNKISSNAPGFFSSVISGEIPVASYFLFTSEALPEYISNRDLIAIITKLPPIVAAEQIKNILSKINSFIPFLGIIIKNTIGLEKSDEPEEAVENLSAQSSISTLNRTEEKTERMLEPAGLINLSKVLKGAQRIFKGFRAEKKPASRKIYRPEEDADNKAPAGRIADITSLSLGKINSLQSLKKDSFLVKEKMFFKKRPSLVNFNLRKALSRLTGLFNLQYLKSMSSQAQDRFQGLSGRKRLLLWLLAGAVILFVASLLITGWSKKQEAVENHYQNILASIAEKQATIDSSLLYDNNEAARASLVEAWELLEYLPRHKKAQISIYENLVKELETQNDKVQRLIRVDNPEQVNDLIGLGVNNIIFADNKLYASAAQKVYEIIPNSSASAIFEAAEATNLSRPQFDSKSLIYYWDGNKLLKFDLKTKKFSALSLDEELANNSNAYKVYSSNLYTLSSQAGKIYKSSAAGTAYRGRTEWLKEGVDLAAATDLFVDGNIYILKNDGQVLKFRLGKLEDYKSASLAPEFSNASKLLITTKAVYVFDPIAKRLAVLASADGHLISQYQIDSLGELKDFAVDEVNRLVYFLNGEMVYRISLD